ncbi:MAG: hypothetical protein AAFZ49_06920 [Cyanobacteria bacterium J06659_2]
MLFELVARGELTTEEAQRVVNEMVNRAESAPKPVTEQPKEPRRIEILDDNDEPTPTGSTTDEAEVLRQQVEALRQELKDIKHQP